MKILICDEYKKVHKQRMRLFAELSKGVVLDIGYAQNQNIYFDENPEIKSVIGIDIDVSRDLPKKYVETKKVDLNKEIIPYPDNYFDSIVCGEVIEHLYNPTELIIDMHRVLKTDHILILSTTSSMYYLEILSSMIGIKLEKDHLHSFSRKEMIRTLNNNGFHVLKVLSYNFWIPIIKLGVISFKLPEFFSWVHIYMCKKE